MKKRFAILAIISLFALGTASASVIGHLQEAQCSGGGVTVTATQIIWSPAGTQSGTGCIDTGISTSITYSNGSLGPGVVGNIANLTFAPNVSVNNFMVFPATGSPQLDFVLTTFPSAVSSDGVCTLTGTGVSGVGHSCVLVAGYTPFLLQYNGLVGGQQNTTITALAGGTVADPGTGQLSNWGGNFHTSLTLDPAQIEAAFQQTGQIVSGQSGDFDMTVIPEPGSMLLIGAGLIGLATALRKRKV